MLSHPSGDAGPDLEPQLLAVLVGVLADLAAPCNRLDIVPGDRIDAHVVVIDQLSQLRADRLADLRDLAQAVETRAQLLDRLELCGPRGHLLVVAGVLDGDAGLRSECLEDVEIVRRPFVTCVVVHGEHADALAVSGQRRQGDRVDPLVGHRRPDVGGPGIVGDIVHGKRSARLVDEVPEGRRCRRRDRFGVGGGEVPGEIGQVAAVWRAPKDAGAIRSEQLHCVLDQAGHDRRKLEARAELQADASERPGLRFLVPNAIDQALAIDRHVERGADRLEQVQITAIHGTSLGDLHDDDTPCLLADADRRKDLDARMNSARPTRSREGGWSGDRAPFAKADLDQANVDLAPAMSLARVSSSVA